MDECMLLLINTGSTSTKIGISKGRKLIYKEVVHHRLSEFRGIVQITDQYPIRMKVINEIIARSGVDPAKLSAVVGRGGVLKPISGGVWIIDEAMLKDLRDPKTNQHASNLSGIIAYKISRELKIPAYTVDPIVVDEMDPVAKVTGLPEISRRSIFHALNQRATARRAAGELGREYREVDLIVAHLGGGISVGAHKRGRVVDVNNGLNGDGPFSPERCGSIPVSDLIALCFSGKYSEQDLQVMVRQGGGLKAYFGTTNTQKIEAKAASEGGRYKLIFEAMAYQISKEIAALGAVFGGVVDGVVITGGLANSPLMVSLITDRIGYLGRLFVYPGEDELEALRDGVLRVIEGSESPQEYE